VPSEVRSIQRRGRTGRFGKGKIVILMAKDTRDEGFYYAARAKEKRMHRTLNEMKSSFAEKLPEQSTLAQYVKSSVDEIVIYADTREQAGGVVKELSETGAKIVVKQLEVGDYLLSNQIVVERKTVEDFLNSVLDGRLFQQLVRMNSNYAMPLIIIEGNPRELFSMRNIHKNAIIGALTSVVLNYRTPFLFTESPAETAEFLFVTAKREQIGKDKDIKLRTGRKGLSLEEQQRFIVESLPLVGPNLAKALLKKFGSIKQIVNADKKQLQEVEKLGPKKADKILKVINEKYSEKT